MEPNLLVIYLIFLDLIKKDYLCLTRRRGGVMVSFLFAFTLAASGSFLFKRIAMTGEDIANTFSGLFALIFAFISTSSANQLFLFEKEESALQGVFLAGASRTSIYLSKFCSLFLYTFILQTIVLVSLALFFNLNLISNSLEFFLVTWLAAAGFSGVATLLASLTSSLSAKDFALPVLLFPLSLLLLIATGINVKEIIISGSLQYSNFWFVLMLIYFILTASCGMFLFEHSVEE